MAIDRHDLTGKIPRAEARYATVVVGAGDAGIAAALAAVGDDGPVLLIDENPLPPQSLATDVPLFFGGRMTAATQNPERMIAQLVAASPALETAFAAGIEVRLGTCAWGLFRNGPAMATLPEPLLGLADAGRAWMIGYDRLVLATGARDVVLGFDGWERPGVMGAQGFHALLTRYAAFAGRRVLILGSDTLALTTARLAREHGVEVAGIVEIAAAIRGPAALAAEIAGAGVPFFLSRTVTGVTGGIDGVTGATLAAVADAPGAAGDGLAVTCDTIVLALGIVPNGELIDAGGGCGDGIARVGDCAGPGPDMAHIAAWSRALGRHAAPATMVCLCEEVTRAELLTMQPPRYLGQPIAPRPLGDFGHPDQVKRLTRAGMGPCQGRRCRTQVACLLAEAGGVSVDRVPVASARAPVRPIPLGILADWQEGVAMAAGWDVWFGIPTQWTPYADIGTPREAAIVARGGNMHV